MFLDFIKKASAENGALVQVSFQLLGAVVVLIFGWLLALLLAKWTRDLLRKMEVGRKLSKCMPEESASAGKKLELWSGRFVFYLVLLFTVLIFLQLIGLSAVAKPVEELVSAFTGYIANIIGALILVLAAYIAATILRYLTATLLVALRADEKLHTQLDDTDGEHFQIAAAAAEAVYWIVFLCFIPGILGVLKIDGILTPFMGMLRKVFEYIPNLAAAIFVLCAGLFAAKIIRKAVTNILISVCSDNLAGKIGLSKYLGRKGLANTAGILAYALVLLPVITLTLDVLKINALTEPVSMLIGKILNASGNIFGAAVLIAAAHIIGRLLAELAAQLLESLGLDRFVQEHCTSLAGGKYPPSNILGKIVYAAVMLFSVIAVCDILGFMSLGNVLSLFIPFAGKFLLGAAVFFFGMYLAGFTEQLLKNRDTARPFAGIAARAVILIFSGAMALHCMGIADEIIQIAFALLFGMFALAGAIAFGFGGRDFAAQKIKEWNEKCHSEKQGK